MKKIIGFILLFIVAALSGWMINISYQKITTKNKIEAGLDKLPGFTFINADSLIVSTHQICTDNSLIIIYFNSECGHCKEEAEQISEDYNRLKGIKILFVSLEPLSKIKAFDEHYGLTELPGVNLGKIDETTAFDILGVASTPQIFIYNRAGSLSKQFRGTTKTEALVKYANM